MTASTPAADAAMPASRGRRAGALAALLASLALALLPTGAWAQTGESEPAAPPAEPRTNLPDVEDEVMCPICGTLLELSQAPQADRQRALIRELIAQGRTKEEIKQALVAEYGEDVLAVPESSGFDATNWLVPIAGLGLALGGLAFGLATLRRRRPRADPAPDPLSPEESGRLEADLRRYDL